MSTLADLRREYEKQAAAAAAEAAKDWEEMLKDLAVIERAIADLRSLHVQQQSLGVGELSPHQTNTHQSAKREKTRVRIRRSI